MKITSFAIKLASKITNYCTSRNTTVEYQTVLFFDFLEAALSRLN